MCGVILGPSPMFSEVDVAGTGLEHLVNGSMGKALSVYATNDADKAARKAVGSSEGFGGGDEVH